jgi:hypothetical protein
VRSSQTGAVTQAGESASAFILAAVLRESVVEMRPLIPVRLGTAMCAMFFNQQGAAATVQKISTVINPLLRKMDSSLRNITAQLCKMLKTTATDSVAVLVPVWKDLILPSDEETRMVKVNRSKDAFATMILEYPELVFYTDLAGKRMSGKDHAAFVSKFSMSTDTMTAPTLPSRRSVISKNSRGRGASNTDEDANAPLEGMLKKRSDWLGRWDTRYFVLNPSELALKYYAGATKDAKNNSVKGRYYFDSGSTVEVDDDDDSIEDFCFIFTSLGGKKVHLSAISKQDREKWMKKLKSTADLQHDVSTHSSAGKTGTFFSLSCSSSIFFFLTVFF